MVLAYLLNDNPVALKQYIRSQQQIMYLQSNVHVKIRSQDEEAPEEALALIHGQMRPGLVIVHNTLLRNDICLLI